MGDDVNGTRSTNSGDSRTKVDSGGYIVWLESRCPIADEGTDETADCQQARDGTQERLQELFNLVGEKAGMSIEVRWTEDVSAETVKANEIVIYLVKDYASGLISSYVDGRIADESLSEGERKAYAVQKAGVANIGEAGLTLNETTWSLSEVYVHDCYQARDAGMRDDVHRNDLLRTSFGRMIANLGFHEAMHNKVDTTHADAWDLHASGGGGLAEAIVSDKNNHTSTNIQLMADDIKTNRAQYIRGQTGAPPPREKPKEEPKKDEKEKSVDSDFAGLDAKVDFNAP